MSKFQQNIEFLLKESPITNDNLIEKFINIINLCPEQVKIQIATAVADEVTKKKVLKDKQNEKKTKLKSLVIQAAPYINKLGEIVKECEELGIDTQEILEEHLKFWWEAEN